MGFFQRIMAANPEVNRDQNNPRWWGASTQQTSAGVAIGPDNAMQVAAVWACVKVISEGIASLPLILYRRRNDGGKDRATDRPLYRTLHDNPNPFQTMFEFVEMLTAHAVLRGDGYAEIVQGLRGPVDQLIPLHPDRVTPEWATDGSVRYRVRNRAGRERVLLQDEVLHLRGLSADGLTGMSVVSYARETMGLAKAAEQFGANLFGQGARPGGVLQHPKNLSDQAALRLQAQFDGRHAGSANAGKTLVLEEGLTWQQVSLTSEDAQFLETRKFQRSEIASWFRVQPHKIGDLEHATFSNIEHMALEYVSDTLLPWARRWEQVISKRLILPQDRPTYFAEFLFDGLLRGDTKSRNEAYAIARQNGWMNADEIRERENMNPIPDGSGKTYLQPLNMQPSTAPGKAPAASDSALVTLAKGNGQHATHL